MSSPFARFGATLVANGFPVIPIKPVDKAPGRWDATGRGWGDLWGWQQYCQRMPTDIEMDTWPNWPDAGVGIPCGIVVAFDIDVMDGELALRIDTMTREMLGDSPIRFGMSPKRLRVYRAATPFASFDVLAGDGHRDRFGTKPLQVLASGRQFVAHGTHPVTQRPYEWPDGSLAETDITDLPEVTEDQAREWATRAAAILGIAWPPVDRGLRPAGDKQLATRAAIEQAIAFVPIDSCRTREDWLYIGMAIHAGLDGDGVDIWDAWSAGTSQTDKNGRSFYDAKKLHAQWSAFGRSGPGAIGPGTLFDAARRNGWHPDDVFLYQWEADAAASAPHFDMTAIIAAVDARNGSAPVSVGERQIDPPAPIVDEPKWTVPAGEPGWLRDLGGGLRMFVDHARYAGHRDQPLLALAASLPVFGSLAGRRYQSDSRLLTNIYTVGLADTGGGKEIGNSVGGELISAAGAGLIRGGEELVSGAGIISALQASPTLFCGLDELGRLISGATSAKGQNSHASDIFKKLLTLFSASQRTYTGVEHANKAERPRVAIERPCLSLYGPTNPTTFWGALSSSESVDGTLARMLVFEAEDSYPEQRRVRYRPIPDDLIEIAKAVYAGVDGHNTFPMGDTAQAAPNPYVVPFSPSADDRYDELLKEQDRLLRKHQGTPAVSAYARIGEMSAKVAMIRAIANNPGAPMIELADYDWAIEIVLACAARMAQAIEEDVADSDWEAGLNRIMKQVKRAGSGGLSRSELCNLVRIDKRQRQAMIEDLIEGGRVEMRSIAPSSAGGPPKVVYFDNS